MTPFFPIHSAQKGIGSCLDAKALQRADNREEIKIDLRRIPSRVVRHACEQSIPIASELPNNPANGGIDVVFPGSEVKFVEDSFRDRCGLDFSIGIFVLLLEIPLCDQPKNFIVVEFVNSRAQRSA